MTTADFLKFDAFMLIVGLGVFLIGLPTFISDFKSGQKKKASRK